MLRNGATDMFWRRWLMPEHTQTQFGEYPVVWNRPGIGRDLAILAKYEAELDSAMAEATETYHRVNGLRDLVDSLRAMQP